LKELQERVGEVLITNEEENNIYRIWAEETADLVQMTQLKIGGSIE
jgi:hypothetical protein